LTKIAFLFPGQGAQYVGMGRDFAEHYPEARQVFEEADERLGYRLSEIIFEGREEELRKTERTQPAILAATIATLKVLENNGIRPAAVAGLSLGEYSALVCAGAMEYSDALPVVQKRAKYMQEAVPLGQGGMAAVLGLEHEEGLKLCRQSQAHGCAEPANYNCPRQVVVAGHREALEEVCRLSREKGARAVMLSVSAPFHCRLQKPVEDKMAAVLEEITLNRPEVPFVANASGQYLSDPSEIKLSLVKQVSHPVLWEDSMRLLLKDGIDFFVEVGPGRTLTAFMKKIDKNVQALHVEDLETHERFLRHLEEG